MASVVLQNVTKQFGAQVVLEGVSLEIHSGELVGLVGANGAGKTTLFKLMVGQEAPGIGTVTRTRGLEVGMLAQEPQLESDRTLHDEVGRAFDELLALERKLQTLAERMAEHHDHPRLPQLMTEYDRLRARFDAAAGYGFQTRLNEILGGLGFSQADTRLPIAALSGGQKCRAALAKLLLQERQLLLLDEPTNHLDMDATRWLERFLAGHHGGAVIVSHDRYLLDRLVSKIIEVEDRRVSVYPGNYSNYVQAKEKRLLARQRQHEKDREFIAKERAFIARHIGHQRTREAKGRRTRLERRLRAGEFVEQAPQRQRRLALKFEQVGRSAPQVLRCQMLAKRYGEKALFENLSFELYPQDRLGIIGGNGTGKTTLLRLILGQVEPDAGNVHLYEQQSVAYYDQEHSGLDRSKRLIDEVQLVRPELGEQQIRSFLGRFLFSGDEVFKPIGQLSGGEQSRVRLARLVLAGPRLLILDEPTNHLDIASREVFEQALVDYQGTIIVVSHDRYFLDRVVNRLLVLEKERHALYSGNYSYYAERLEEARQAEARSDAPVRSGKRARPARNSARPDRPPPSPYDGLSLEEIEERIIAKEQEVEAINQRFADESVYRNPEVLRDLRLRLQQASAEVETLNQAWEQRADASGA